jgi:UDPglucose 6-dehydrogenase
MDLSSIGIIGIGVVGSAIKTFYKNKAVRVYTYDKFKDEGSVEECTRANIIFLCLPTLFDGNEFDKEAIYAACQNLLEAEYRGIVVLKSTVEPGTTCSLESKYPGLRIVHNPEFLSADTAVRDFENQSHIVIGGAKDLTNELASFYKLHFPLAEITEATSVESESMKIFVNSFYAVKIQFFNELYLTCKCNGADFTTVKNMMIKNGWIHPMHTEVPGKDGMLSYGGMCFPKDTSALLNYMKREHIPCAVLNATVCERNEFRDDYSDTK